MASGASQSGGTGGSGGTSGGSTPDPYVYGAPTLNAGGFGIEDILYPWTPASFNLESEDYGVRGMSVPTLSLGRVIVIPGTVSDTAWYGFDEENKFVNFRKMFRQKWNAQWDNDSVMSRTMRDHVMVLYTTQKPFWIIFDDEISYPDVAMEPADSS